MKKCENCKFYSVALHEYCEVNETGVCVCSRPYFFVHKNDGFYCGEYIYYKHKRSFALLTKQFISKIKRYFFGKVEIDINPNGRGQNEIHIKKRSKH